MSFAVAVQYFTFPLAFLHRTINSHPTSYRFEKKLDDSQPVLGMLVMNHFWLELVEIAQAAGLDYMIIDLEHHPRDGELVANACRIGRLAGFAIFLRSRRTDAESIGEVLDLGPCGLLLPMIESAEQLDGVRDGIYLPPRGRRRPGGPGNRWAKQADYEGFKSTVEDHLVVLPQIESQTGLKNVQESPTTRSRRPWP